MAFRMRYGKAGQKVLYKIWQMNLKNAGRRMSFREHGRKLILNGCLRKVTLWK